MSITEKYAQHQKDRRENFGEKDESKKEIEGPTLKEILANKEQQDLFGEYLETEGVKDLGSKLAGPRLEVDSNDFAALEEKRKGFLEILDRSKSITESLDANTLTKLVASSPELQTIAGMVGRDGIKAALSKHLPRAAITERQRFIDLEDALQQMAESKKKLDEEDEDIKKWCKENGIAEGEYLELLQTGDPEKIVKLARSQYSLWQKIATRRKKQENEVHQQSLDNARDIEEYWERYEADMKDVGSLLQLTMMENPLIKESLVADLKKDSPEKSEPNMSFAEMKEVRNSILQTKASKEELNSAFDVYRRGHQEMNDDEALHGFSKAYTQDKLKGKKGFWASILASLFLQRLSKL